MPWNKPGRLKPDDDNNPTPVERREQEKPTHNPPDLQTLLRQGGKWMGDRLRRHPRVSKKKRGVGHVHSPIPLNGCTTWPVCFF